MNKITISRAFKSPMHNMGIHFIILLVIFHYLNIRYNHLQ